MTYFALTPCRKVVWTYVKHGQIRSSSLMYTSRAKDEKHVCSQWPKQFVLFSFSSVFPTLNSHM